MNDFSEQLSNMIMPEYVRKMGMSIAPFSDLYNETLYYQNDARVDLQKKIAHLLEYTTLVLFLQGAEGVGKSSILKQRISNAKDNWKICYLSAKDYTSTELFVAKIAEDFKLHLSTNYIGSPAASLQEQLVSLQHTGLFPILIIDDIEQLKESLIPMIMSFVYTQEDQQPKLRLIVSGEDIPEKLLQNLSDKDKEDNIKYLPAVPLSQQETADYIKFRMRAAGYEKKIPFSAEVLKKIYLDAKGFPKHINQLANHYLSRYSQGKVANPPLINLKENNRLLRIAAGVLVVVVGSIILITTSEIEPAKNNRETSSLALPDTIAEAKINFEPKNPIVKLSAQNILLKKSSRPDTPRATTDNAKEMPLPIPPSKNNWIASQNKKNYTLQLIGSSKKSSAENFISRHKINKDAHIYTSTRKGKPWFSVIYKSFPSHKSARIALTSLPESLQKTQPWIRQFSQIKNH